MIEVFKQAVDWAEKHGEVVFAGGGMKAIEPMNDWVQAGRQAIAEFDSHTLYREGYVNGYAFGEAAGKQAIAELESQEPVKYEHKAYTMPPQPEQKTSADDFFKTIADKNPKPFPPPQRTWVGLTDEEIKEFDTWYDNREEEVGWCNPSEIVAYIEAKLKEKNNA